MFAVHQQQFPNCRKHFAGSVIFPGPLQEACFVNTQMFQKVQNLGEAFVRRAASATELLGDKDLRKSVSFLGPSTV